MVDENQQKINEIDKEAEQKRKHSKQILALH